MFKPESEPPIQAEKAKLELPVDTETVARYFGWSTPTVRRLAVENKIPSFGYRNGNRTFRRFRISAVQAALDKLGEE